MQGIPVKRGRKRWIFRLGVSVVLLVPIVALFHNFAASDEGFQSIPLKNFSIVPAEKSGGVSAQSAFRGALELRWDRKRFGGLSGLHVDRTGKHLISISDRGVWFAAELVFDAGRLAAARDARLKRLIGPDGAKLKRREGDAEALSSDGAGGFVVAFERRHNLLHYPGWRRPFFLRPRQIKTPPDVQALPSNHGIEAMTRLCDGRYLLIAERGETGGKETESPVMAWLGGEGDWTRRTLLRRAGFSITGATTLSDCSIAVIERQQHASGQWITGIRRFPLDRFNTAAGQPLSGQIVLGPFSSIAKFEGIAAHKSGAGDERLFLMSDNDFKGPTILAAFTVVLK
ncbi:MAG: esterase-like activity of phytase family protein [Proteobacteria bacterium]|nr:esterase-like activity of phytase family protein [Pseudomonadota bacterium]